MRDTLLVVANSSCARFFLGEEHKKLKEIRDIYNPMARLRMVETYTDRPGKMHGSGFSNSHAVSDESRRKKEYLRRYARRVCHAIANHANKSGPLNIVFIATPVMISMFRSKLNKRFLEKVTYTLKKDVVGKTAGEVAELLPPEYRKHIRIG